MTNYPLIGVVNVTWPVLLHFAPLELVKLGTSKFHVLIDIQEF